MYNGCINKPIYKKKIEHLKNDKKIDKINCYLTNLIFVLLSIS
jgi:hypothetical protein